MIGQNIIAAANPKGHSETIFVSGTPLPGTFMEIVPAVDRQGGRFTYRNVTRAVGSKGPVAILTADNLQGKTPFDAYTNGSMAVIYWPIAGEELNALISESAGTGTAGEENIGDLLSIQVGGQLQAAGAAASAPFALLEHGGVDGLVDTLKLVKYLGNQA